MRLGLIARRDNTGLGYQTLSYYKHLKPTKTLVIDISNLNGQKQNPEWYPNEQVVLGFPNQMQIKHFLDGLDLVLTAETPYNYDLYNMAKERGVKVANVVNWEFFDHLKSPELPVPDLIIMPSTWYLEEAQLFAQMKGIKCIHLHHPVDRSEISYRERTTYKTFHIAGKPAAHDRNGTNDYLAAVPNGKVITQSEDLAHQIRSRYRHSNVYTNIDDRNFMYQVGDILVFPRRYGGNCLPLNEALASGAPVIMPDIKPNNDLLPKEWLVHAKKITEFTPRTTIDVYATPVEVLRERIDWFKSQDISKLSRQANDIAQSISWEVMKDKWLQALQEL